MSDIRGRMETGRTGSAMGGPDTARTQTGPLPHEPPTEGNPADVSRGVEARLADQGIEVNHDDLQELAATPVKVGPTAGGG